MAKQTILLGTAPNGTGGDTSRAAQTKINSNFNELYASVAAATTGTVTSVNLAAPAAGLSVSGGPITNAGSISISLVNDLAALENLSGTGYAKRTGADSWATSASIPFSDISSKPTTLAGYGITDATNGTVTSINLTAPAAGITVSGGPITTSGSITISLANDLAALEGLSGTGFAKRTGANAWSTVSSISLASDVTGNLPVTNLNGGAFASSVTFWRGDGIWAVPDGGGSVDLSEPGPIGDVTPDTGDFTTLTADDLTVTGTFDASGATTSIGNIDFSGALATNNTYTGFSIAGLNAGATIAQWTAVYMGSSGKWLIADANGTGTFPARGIAVAAGTDNNPLRVLTHGTVRNDTWNWTQGATIYLSGTAGGLTQTVPAASGDNVQQVGFALTADVAYFNFGSSEYITLA